MFPVAASQTQRPRGIAARQHSALMALLLLTSTSVAAVVGPRVDVLGRASLSQLTHTTCAVSRTAAAGGNQFLMIEGPQCKPDGGECQHVALMKIDRHTVSLARVGEPRKAANGTWSSVFKQGDRTLSVDLIRKRAPRAAADGNDSYAAVLTLRDGKGGATMVKGVASCEGD